MLPPMLKALPPNWSAPSDRPEIQQAVAALQDPNVGSPAQLSQELMDTTGSVAAASEIAASKTLSERQERQVTEGIMMLGPEFREPEMKMMMITMMKMKVMGRGRGIASG